MKIWKYIVHLIRFRPQLYIAAFVLWALVHGLPLIAGLILRAIFDALSNNANLYGPVGLLIGALVLVMLSRACVLLFGFYADFSFIFSVVALLRKNTLKGILQRPGALALNDSIGGAISRFRDDAKEIAEFCGWTADLIYRPAFAITALIIMLLINVPLTLVIFIPMIIMTFVSNLAKQRIETYRRASREILGKVTGFIGDVFGAVETVKINGAEEHMAAYLQTLNAKRQSLSIKETLFSELLNTIFANTIGLGTGLILLLAVGAMQNGSFKVGDLALFIFYLSWLGEVTHFMGRLMARLRQAGVSFERVLALQGASYDDLVQHGPIYHDEEEGKNPVLMARQEPLQILEAKNLKYRYPSSHQGIDGISFSLPKGSLTVVCGRIGSGKTTLLRVLLGLLPKEEGSVYWNGSLIQKEDDFFLPPRTAYLPQAPHLFNDTLRQNILLGWPDDEHNLKQALEQAVLDHDLAAMEQGWETLIGAKGIEPSGGQKQRIAAARMFIRKADLLVIDDMSSALDFHTEQLLWERLQQTGGTFLVASTRPTVLQRADKILLLQNGRLLDEGNLDELLERTTEMREVFTMSVREQKVGEGDEIR
ncbi:MAG TPA: ABC transporter ATP-binding protein [Ktedonobacteraceae bacterium]|nr:ABC transporter ATP-binding protein [Ktedonobacteraceae bacterium]